MEEEEEGNPLKRDFEEIEDDFLALGDVSPEMEHKYGDELVMPESDGGSTPKRARTDADGDGEGDDAESAEWLFNCICGERVRSSAPVERHPQGDMFACEQCNEWSHLNCYVEFKDFSNEELDLAKIYCRRCQPSESALFNLATKTIARILELGDVGARKQCVLVCKSLWSMARGAESSLKIRHVSPDVAFHLLEQSPNLRALTLYCWHTKLARVVNVALRELTIISAAPAPSLGALPRNIEELRVYDAAVTDAGVMAALGRSGRGMGSLRVLDLAGSSVTASISPQLFPASLTTLILCATPTNDAGMMLNVCRPDDSGTQFPNLRHLDLSHTLVTGAILRHIPRKLHVLNLAFTGVTMEGLRSMLGLPRLQLKTLFLMGVRDVDKGALSELAPKVTIIL